MKAFQVLMALHSIDLRKGYQYLDAPRKEGLALVVKQGKIKRNHWYFCDFHQHTKLGEPSVICTLGGGDTQYLYEVEKS